LVEGRRRAQHGELPQRRAYICKNNQFPCGRGSAVLRDDSLFGNGENVLPARGEINAE